MMTCTSGTNDSLTRLSPSSELDQTDNQNDTSFYVMQNRPPYEFKKCRNLIYLFVFQGYGTNNHKSIN
jgi:hypothetical protein